jgi:hypothetical protein
MAMVTGEGRLEKTANKSARISTAVLKAIQLGDRVRP